MSKRKRDVGLAQEVLSEKLAFLESKKVEILESRSTTLEAGAENLGAWDYLLDVCLAYERARGVVELPKVSGDRFREADGEYDYVALQNEDIYQGMNHAGFVGPVTVSRLPEPKLQGVAATRDILKGELLCSSVPQIVVPNLAPRDDPTDMLFSDLSRAEMTARLIILADDQAIYDKLRCLEYAGKAADENHSVRDVCREIISKYTWAIDHPSTNPRGSLYRSRETKVAGHAFTIDGYAGKFNHSCVPNATMVSYGAVQFFRANCSITKGAEICVSYGYDAGDAVEQRRAKLEEHAGFLCSCALCKYELDLAKSNQISNAHLHASQSITFDDLLKEVLHHGLSPHRGLEQFSQLGTTTRQLKASLVTTLCLLDGDEDSSCLPIYQDIPILRCLWLYPRILKIIDDTAQHPKGVSELLLNKHKMLLNCLLLCIMSITLIVERPIDVGVPFGDLFRLRIAGLVTCLSEDSWIKIGNKGNALKPYMTAAMWQMKSFEYTDSF